MELLPLLEAFGNRFTKPGSAAHFHSQATSGMITL
jgi:hypothetical protein